MYNYQDGKKLLLDITIADPWAKKYLLGSSERAAFAAVEKEKEKNAKYLEMASPWDIYSTQ